MGRTENISRSGLLVRGEESVDVDAPVELRVELPTAPAGKKDPTEIWCHGRVVRTISESDDWMEPGYAVMIESYDLLPASAEFLAH